MCKKNRNNANWLIYKNVKWQKIVKNGIKKNNNIQNVIYRYKI